jgi:hypothetical protein
MMSEQKAAAEKMFFSTAHPEDLSEIDMLASAYFSASNVGLCTVDSSLHYIAINKTLAETNGIPAEAHLGRTVRDILGILRSQGRRKSMRCLRHTSTYVLRSPENFLRGRKASTESCTTFRLQMRRARSAALRVSY